jgi:hypothetical protein
MNILLYIHCFSDHMDRITSADFETLRLVNNRITDEIGILNTFPLCALFCIE